MAIKKTSYKNADKQDPAKKAPIKELKPDKIAYLLTGMVWRWIAVILIFGILYAINYFTLKWSWIWFVAAALIILVLLKVDLFIRYKKESYAFYDDKIIRKSGGLLSDSEAQLIIRNISHVETVLPFLQHSLFKTANLRIDSSGSGAADIHLSSIKDIKENTEFVKTLMRKNGFKITFSTIVQEERPSILGSFFETVGRMFSILFVFIFFGIYGISAIKIGAQPFFKSHFMLVFSIFLAIFLILFVWSAMIFLDLINRIYKVYSDAIVYYEGFLTKHYSFMPNENLSDTAFTQTIIDKLFDLYDVKISCQGANQQIWFKNLKNGPQMKATVDRIISSKKSMPAASAKNKEGTAREQSKSNKAQQDSMHFDLSNFKSEFRMNAAKTLLPLLVLLPICIFFLDFLFVWILIFLTSAMRVFGTIYYIKDKSIEERFDFLSSRHAEFATEKITGVVIHESLIDKLFGTFSITFWSIGSSQNVRFRNIKKQEGLALEIAKDTGIKKENEIYTLNSKFSIIEFFKANLYIHLIAIVAAVACVIAAIYYKPYFYAGLPLILILYIIAIIYGGFLYKRSWMNVYKNSIYFHKGIIMEQKYFVLNNNIKKSALKRYPLSKLGSMTFEIAGEHIVNEEKNQQASAVNSFNMDYVKDIEAKKKIVDDILSNKVSKAQLQSIDHDPSLAKEKPALHSTRQDMRNSYAFWTPICIILFPLLLAWPFLIAYAKSKKYVIDQDRLVERQGVFYKTQLSVRFASIDHISVHQNILNKWFNNGTVHIHTTGSSKVEMVIRNLPDYQEFYGLLKTKYKARTL